MNSASSTVSWRRNKRGVSKTAIQGGTGKKRGAATAAAPTVVSAAIKSRLRFAFR